MNVSTIRIGCILLFVITATPRAFGDGCCLTDGTCIDVPPKQCASHGGVPTPGEPCGGRGCSSPAGACCRPDGTCVETFSFFCDDFGGIFSPGLRCSEITCTSFQACCLTDGSCIMAPATYCFDAGGFTILGADCSIDCDPYVPRACCRFFAGGTCSMQLPADCARFFGIVQAYGSTCDDVDCHPFPSSGGCCLPLGCLEMSGPDCVASGGVFLGQDVTCASGGCFVPQACCLPDGSCQTFVPQQCFAFGGSPAGPGSDCQSASCTTSCPADLTNSTGGGPDGVVNVFDLFVLLSNWNSNGPGANLAAPFNIVDVFDLFVLLGAWGDC